jgi:fucose permease
MFLIILSLAVFPAIPALIGRLKKQDYNKKKTGYALILKKRTLWLSVMILTFGVICEVGVGAWLVNFLEKTYAFTGEQAALRLTLYFVCFTLARLLLGPLIDKIGFINSLVISTAFAGVMITVGVLAGEAGTPLLAIAGIGTAPVFPTVMAVLAKLFSDEIDLAITAVTTIMGIILVPANILLGGIINQLRLLLTDIYGEAGVGMAYSAGFLFVGLCCFTSFTFALILRANQKKSGKLV